MHKLLIGLAGLLLLANTYPTPTNNMPVIDQADIIPADKERELNQRLIDFEAKNKNTLVIATVKSLGDETIEEYATGMFRELGIGHAVSNNGVLLLVAPNDRKVRIETGYGIREGLTDMKSGQIIRNDILPEFKNGDMVAGIDAGTDAILTAITPMTAERKEYLQKQAARARMESQKRWDTFWNGVWWMFLGALAASPFIWFWRRRVRKRLEAEEAAREAEYARHREAMAEAERQRVAEQLRKTAEATRKRNEMLARMTPAERDRFFENERETARQLEARRRRREEQAAREAEAAREAAAKRRAAERRRSNDNDSYGGGYSGSSSSSSSSSSSDSGSSFGGFDGGSSGGGGSSGSW